MASDDSASASSKSDSSDDDFSDEDENPGGATAFFQGARKPGTAECKPKAKAKPKASQNPAPKNTKTRGRAMASQPGCQEEADLSTKLSRSEKAGKTAKTQLEGSAKAAKAAKGAPEKSQTTEDLGLGSDMFCMDGRGKRAMKTLLDKVAEYKKAVQDVDMGDAVPGPGKEERDEFKLSCIKRAAKVRTIGRNCKEVIRRSEKSTNADSFKEPVANLEALGSVCGDLEKLLMNAPLEHPDAESVIQAYEACQEACQSSVFEPEGKELGPAFQLRYLFAKASVCCLYQDYAGFCKNFRWDNEVAVQLLRTLDRDELQGHIVAEVENRILLALRNVKPQDLQALNAGKVVGSLGEALALCRAVAASAAEEGESGFIPFVLKNDATTAASLLSQGQDDMATLAESVEIISDLQAAIIQKDDYVIQDTQAIERFFAQHDTGKTLLDLASGRVESGAKEAEAQKHLDNLEVCCKKMANFVSQRQRGSPMCAKLLGGGLVDSLFVSAFKHYQNASATIAALDHAKKDACKAKHLAKALDGLRAGLEKLRVMMEDLLSECSKWHLQVGIVPHLRLVC